MIEVTQVPGGDGPVLDEPALIVGIVGLFVVGGGIRRERVFQRIASGSFIMLNEDIVGARGNVVHGHRVACCLMIAVYTVTFLYFSVFEGTEGNII
jgi:hypothetical protein